jgi:hypothetical protein
MIRRKRHNSKTQLEFAFDGGLGIVVRGDRCFEGAIVIGVLQAVDHGFGGESVPKGVATRHPLTFKALRPGTLERISSVRLKIASTMSLIGRSHGRSDAISLRLFNYWCA